jgi:hypothetical protein
MKIYFEPIANTLKQASKQTTRSPLAPSPSETRRLVEVAKEYNRKKLARKVEDSK